MLKPADWIGLWVERSQWPLCVGETLTKPETPHRDRVGFEAVTRCLAQCTSGTIFKNHDRSARR
jgi:hypothetical protein